MSAKKLAEKCIWVTGLPSISPDELKSIFSHYGPVSHVIASIPEALILFGSPSVAKKALHFDGKAIHGVDVNVSYPTPEQFDSVSKYLAIEIAKTRTSVAADLDNAISLLDSDSKQKVLDFIVAQSAASDEDTPVIQPARSLSSAATQIVSHCSSVPRLSNFSGDDSKNEVSYIQWKHEVRSLLVEGNPHPSIHQSIRRSLKGSAASVLLNLGETVTIAEILQKFDVVFVVALSNESLLEDFYKARQNSNESVVSWSCRVESLLTMVKEKGAVISDGSRMVCSKFWSGLTNDRIKQGLRHKFDSGATFNELLVAARSIEQESDTTQASHSIQSHSGKEAKVTFQKTSVDDKLDQMLSKMTTIENRLTKLESSKSKFCNYCKRSGHVISDCRKRPQNRGNDQVSVQRGTVQTQTEHSPK